MQLGIHGRTAIVTGGSQGIGRVIAERLIGEGARVVVCARTAGLLERTAQEIGALAIAADVSRAEDVQALVSRTVERFGGVDILVNCAASPRSEPFMEMGEDEWLEHFQVKLLGDVRCMREVIPHMRAKHWGRIVSMAGIAAREAATGYASGAVNSALVNVTKKLGDEVGPDGITVNAIHPGPVLTGRREAAYQRLMREKGISREEAMRDHVARIPIGRLIDPGDIADAVLFLASDRASAITGQVLAIDGGSGSGVYY
jgi:NAD(P)-dependent dehydrogenase (short-subunit alcohol dehydrogenase family)